MAKVSTGSVLGDSWNLIYNTFISQISDIGNTPSRSGSDFIFSAWPNRATVNRAQWTNYPIVVLTADVTRGMNYTLNSTMRDWTVSFSADIFNKSQKNADQMMDNILRTLQNYRSNYEGSGLVSFSIEGMSNSDITDLGGALVHMKTLNWNYIFRELN